MTKNDVVLLCEYHDKLQWWAMILFAEICDFAEAAQSYENNDKMIADYVRSKNNEFPRLVVQEQLNKAKADAERIANAGEGD